MSKDYYLPRRLASWNPTRGLWETGQADLLSEQLEPWSETWPLSGMWVDGVAFELPMPELPMLGSGSSLLPTPNTMDMLPAREGEALEKVLHRGDLTGSRRAQASNLRERVAMELMPTPVANDSGNTPEDHLRKKPGRTKVTSLQVLVNFDLLQTGGRIEKPSPDGNSLPGM